MQNELKIALLQSDLAWEDAAQNRKNLGVALRGIAQTIDVIVLPEMFATGFTMNAEKVAEPMDGDTVAWMKQMATKTNAAIAGSLVISEERKFYNRFLFVEPSGKISIYNKRHTFTLAGENKVYTAGSKQVIIDYKGWKICPQVCYDLRFPVWSRNVEGYHVLIYVANWPKPRISAWNTLLQARAIENMSYCIGVNRVGVDGTNIEYSGHSAAYDVLGNKITTIEPKQEQIETITLEKRHVEAYRNKFKFLDDRDAFKII
ncbi:amidohydrolase [Flavobacteriaceae bacterium GSB9]|nr:amidohydrolase [Flavobacteriaceae bacterium GSB9]